MVKRSELNKTVNTPGQKMDSSFTHYRNTQSKRHHNIIKRMNKIIEYVSGPKVLDCGCGTGLICFLVSELEDVKEIHGVDLQKSVLIEAKKNVTSDKVKFHNGFIEEVNFKSDYFDTVVMGEVIEHVYSVDQTLKEANKVLKKNGSLIITCPYKGKLSALHIRSISKEFLREKMERYFKIKTIEIIKYNNQPSTLFCVGIKN